MKSKRELFTPGEVPVLMMFGNTLGAHTLGCPCPFPQENTQAQEPPLQQKCVWASTIFLREGWIRPRADNAKKDP